MNFHVDNTKHILKGFMLFLLLGNLCAISMGPRPVQDSEQLEAMADALKYLQELDTYYAREARPRSTYDPSISVNELEHKLKFIRLQALGKMFSSKSRPRFGKRGNGFQWSSASITELGQNPFGER